MRLGVLAVRCKDIHATANFYSLLGMNFETHDHDNEIHMACKMDWGMFELFPNGKKWATDARLGLVVEDIELEHQKMTNAGYNPRSIEGHRWGRVFRVLDPDGRDVDIASKIEGNDAAGT